MNMLIPLNAKTEAPSIFYNREDLGDAPALHRWRASWWRFADNGDCYGVCLTAYPVVRLTRCGAWISTDNDWDWDYSGEEPVAIWRPYWPPGSEGEKRNRRWVANDSDSAWAKPTRDAAIHSIAYRLYRWSQVLSRDARRVRGAEAALRRLAPRETPFCDMVGLVMDEMAR